MKDLKLDTDLFSTELPLDGVIVIRMKRHLIEHMSLLTEKEKFWKFLDQVESEPDIKCVVVIGHPEKRGEAEFEEWHQSIHQNQEDAFAVQRVVNAIQQYVRRLLMMPQVVLYGDAAALTTNYLSLGLASNYFVLSDTVQIFNTNAKYNLLPVGGVAYMLGQKIGSTQTLLGLTAKESISAQQALDLGICEEICPANQVEERLIRQAVKFTEFDISYLTSLKSAIRPDMTQLDRWFQQELRTIVRDSY